MYYAKRDIMQRRLTKTYPYRKFIIHIVSKMVLTHTGTSMVVVSIVMINFEELSAGYHRRRVLGVPHVSRGDKPSVCAWRTLLDVK